MSKIFGERLRELRKQKGLDQNQMAKELGFSNAMISFWENGKNEPTESSITVIAKYFNVTADFLLGLDE